MRRRLLHCAVAAALCAASIQDAFVIVDETSPYGLKVLPGPPTTSAIAWGNFDSDVYSTTGWAVLNIAASEAEGNATLSTYAAGFLEGALTVKELTFFLNNTGSWNPNSAALQDFIDANYAWMLLQIDNLGSTDPYWAHLAAVLGHIQGIADGHASAGGPAPWSVIYQNIINSGDLGDLIAIFGASEEQLSSSPNIRRRFGSPAGSAAAAAAPPLHKKTDHCSALVKLTPGAQDIAIAHATWAGLENLYRVLKRYDLPLAGISGSPVPGRITALSSFLGLVHSSDDFYVLSSGLVTLETTIDCANLTLARQYIQPESVLEWLRNVLANRLATDGPTWADVFSRYASGTYTNQWMIVDSNLFTPGQKAPPNTLTVLEEMPGNIRVHDRTPDLNGDAGSLNAWGIQGWASYNAISDPYLFDISGAQALVDEYGGVDGPGAYYSFLNTSRANIFRRNASSVVDAPSMQAMIRWNEFETDPLSTLGCSTTPPYSATNAIADRSDLNDPSGNYVIPDVGWGDSAGLDAKITLVSWVQQANVAKGVLPFVAQSGPTVSASCPPFDFKNSSVSVPHEGYNDLWDFQWVSSPFTEPFVLQRQ